MACYPRLPPIACGCSIVSCYISHLAPEKGTFVDVPKFQNNSEQIVFFELTSYHTSLDDHASLTRYVKRLYHHEANDVQSSNSAGGLDHAETLPESCRSVQNEPCRLAFVHHRPSFLPRVALFPPSRPSYRHAFFLFSQPLVFVLLCLTKGGSCASVH